MSLHDELDRVNARFNEEVNERNRLEAELEAALKKNEEKQDLVDYDTGKIQLKNGSWVEQAILSPKDPVEEHAQDPVSVVTTSKTFHEHNRSP